MNSLEQENKVSMMLFVELDKVLNKQIIDNKIEHKTYTVPGVEQYQDIS